MTYFEAFGLEPKLVLDPADLQSRFYRLSREFHPDKFTRKSETEQQRALEMTSLLNDGLRVLRDPVKRAEYILTSQGFPIAEQRTKDVPPELLEEVFELNMALEESDTAQLSQLKTRFTTLLHDIDADLARLFAAYDSSRDESTLGRIRSVLNRRRYIENLIAKIELTNSSQ